MSEEKKDATTPAAAMVVHGDDGLSMLFSASEATDRLRELQAFVKSVMVHGEDYGTIPGTDRPTLYKPGAEKMAEIYGLRPEYEDVVATEDWLAGFFFYRLKCRLFRGDRAIAEGVGSCNSLETRYAGKWTFDNKVPPGVDLSKLKSKSGTKNGRKWVMYLLPHDASGVADLVNTILKMAKKRAYVDAVLTATRSSNLFTQDVEDFRDVAEEPKRAAGDVPDAEFEEVPAERPPFMSEVEFDDVCAKWRTVDEPTQRAQWARMNPRQKEVWKERQAQAKRNAAKREATEPLPQGWGGPADSATSDVGRQPGED